MAIMINCAHDWSFDLFVADCNSYKALPIKGVYCRQGASDNEVFISTLKRICNDWIRDNTECFTVRGINSSNCEYSYVEYCDMADALWSFLCNEVYISDWYKDIYNQRPHLDKDLYLWALGYHDLVDTLLWCGLSFRRMNDIIGDFVHSARDIRIRMEEYACNN